MIAAAGYLLVAALAFIAGILYAFVHIARRIHPTTLERIRRDMKAWRIVHGRLP